VGSFSVTVRPAADDMCTVVQLAGEADMTTTALRDALSAEVARKPRLLLIDMAALTFIDSAATQMIVAAHQALRREGGTLALVHPGPAVGRVLELVGVGRVIPVYGSAREAMTTAGPPRPG
jgi:anti-sigma B factor antagonist